MPQPNSDSNHVIRLLGPWRAEVLSAESALEGTETSRKQKIPSTWQSWLGDHFLGTVSYKRFFRVPTNLSPHQKVWLIVEPVDFAGCVHLNDSQLGMVQLGGPNFRHDASQLLRPRNELRIDVRLSKDDIDSPRAGGIIGEVRLEIEGT